jgi:hypothetical protein
MKKVALTAAVLALGLAACQPKAETNNEAADTNVENAAAVDTNIATNDAMANADAALNATDNTTANTADNGVANATTNY